VIGEQLGGCIGRAFPLHHQHRCLVALAQARQAAERPGCRPLAGEGITAAGPVPAAIEPHPMQENLAALAAQAEPLDPEQRVPRRIAVTPLGDGALVQRRRSGIGRWRFRLAPVPFPVLTGWGRCRPVPSGSRPR
jgi:hypothetical protein